MYVVTQVEPLNGPEWGVSIAVGAGAILYSWATRFIIRSGSYLYRKWRGPRTGGSGQSTGKEGSGKAAAVIIGLDKELARSEIEAAASTPESGSRTPSYPSKLPEV
jgi:hypothetical protein